MSKTPRFSVVESMMPRQTLAQDLEVCVAVGVEGICISEGKLEKDEDDLGRLKTSCLEVSSAFPTMQVILPAPHAPVPLEPAERISRIVASIRRLAAFGPSCINITTGPLGRYDQECGRAIVVEALQEFARVAGDHDMTIAVEVMHPSIRDRFSFLTSISDGLSLLDDTGASNVALALDAWHVGDSPSVLAELREHAERFATFHVDDWREPTRSWADRVLPGDGVLDLEAIFGSLDAGGFDGWFELEVISDDGSIEQEFADSLWKQDPLELVAAGHRQFTSIWDRRHASRPVGQQNEGSD